MIIPQEKLNKVCKTIIDEKGSLLFFSLVKRPTDGNWDLVMSANWIEDGNTRDSVKYLITKLKNESLADNIAINQLVIYSANENFVQHLGKAIQKNPIKNFVEQNIEIFKDFSITVFVFHHEFDDFVAKTITKKDYATVDF